MSNQRLKYRIQVKQFCEIIHNNSDIKIVKYLGAHNWPMLKNGKDSREEAINQGWNIVERKAHDMYEIVDGDNLTQITV